MLNKKHLLLLDKLKSMMHHNLLYELVNLTLKSNVNRNLKSMIKMVMDQWIVMKQHKIIQKMQKVHSTTVVLLVKQENVMMVN